MKRGNTFITAFALLLALFAIFVTSAPTTNTLTIRADKVTPDYDLTYFPAPLISTSTSKALILAEGASAAADRMQITVCTGPLIYYGECMAIQIEKDGCIDFHAGGKYDDSISSIEVQTQGALCRVWEGHRCLEGDSTWLNEGDMSRDRVKFAPFNDTVSSLGCYWDPRGVTGVWEAGFADGGFV
jgi:hypothetical protein